MKKLGVWKFAHCELEIEIEIEPTLKIRFSSEPP